ncbi:hypothetical protein D6779_01370 [Candidatus Parcubacteria bacterium]|nr:MAG: hypothetical protein D6779_01370 [Candidatus Parcubacteria bacterium]
MAEGIYKRKRKTGGYTYQAKIRKGKKTVVSRSFDSFAEAKAWHAEMMAKLNRVSILFRVRRISRLRGG